MPGAIVLPSTLPMPLVVTYINPNLQYTRSVNPLLLADSCATAANLASLPGLICPLCHPITTLSHYPFLHSAHTCPVQPLPSLPPTLCAGLPLPAGVRHHWHVGHHANTGIPHLWQPCSRLCWQNASSAGIILQQNWVISGSRNAETWGKCYPVALCLWNRIHQHTFLMRLLLRKQQVPYKSWKMLQTSSCNTCIFWKWK